MIVHNEIEQNTDAWTQIKLGKFSASNCADLLMATKCEGYKKLIKRIVEERITGLPSESKWMGNKYTERGHDLEPIAIQNYEFSTFTKAHRVGFIEHDSLWYGCSPDALLGENGLLQVKNPIFATQLDYLEDQEIPTDYYKQMQFELMVCEREYDIFHSFHPALPALTLRVNRDEKMIAEIQEKLKIAVEEVNQRINKLKGI
jgi:predicted phage-related endonuclease